MKYLKLVNALFDGKKRAIGGFAYVIIDCLIAIKKLEPDVGNQLKIVAGMVFTGGVAHAAVKRGK